MTPRYPALDLSAIKLLNFPDGQFYKVETAKKQICIHHTASGKGIDGDFRHWLTTPERVATHVVIGYDGTINQLYNSRYWGHHLGIKNQVFSEYDIPPHYRRTHTGKAYHANNEILNQECIGIEIDAWGPLALHDGHYKSYVGTIVDINEVQLYRVPFKTFPKSDFFDKIGVTGKPCYHYHKYSAAQIKSTAQLLIHWCVEYNIPWVYQENMWDVSREALAGYPGIWTHVSYRSDKNDCHPQPELIEMLKSLDNA